MRRPLSVIFVLFLAMFFACSSGGSGDKNSNQDVTEDNSSRNNNTTEDANGNDEIGNANCKLKVSLKGKAYLISKLVVKEPAGTNGGLARALTDLWKADIEKGKLIILFYVDKYDASTGQITLKVGTGIKDSDGKYAFIKDPGPSPLEAKMDGCKFSTVLKGKLVLYPNTVTSYIPIVSMDGYGTFDENGTKITLGKLKGAICQDAAKKIWFDMLGRDFDPNNPPNCANFENFMHGLKISPNRHDLNGVCETNPDGYSFVGNFEAKEIKNFKKDLVDQKHTFKCANVPEQ